MKPVLHLQSPAVNSLEPADGTWYCHITVSVKMTDVFPNLVCTNSHS